ncbi:MAG: polyisoprenyl-phosphate glycosyltransferase [Thermoanaerobaculia bacterium]|jgi:dolichol-phosphate mannosyltransferase|nr:polyisoprenyl-phosphate glycosyltransferase [Thermoanaerobaculia bacterium]
MTIRYSFVVPIYNDGRLARAFAAEFEQVFQQYLSIIDLTSQVELIFVNDGSGDDSDIQLRKVCETFLFAKSISLSRNFGQHIAVSCGYHHASGNFVGMLNVDMEDPPGEIPNLLAVLENGDHDIVYGLYGARNVPFSRRITSLAFAHTLNWLTGARVPTNVSTLRVMNRTFVEAYNSLEERARYLPGLESWLGFKHGYVSVRHQKRKVGRSSYSFRSRLRMAIESVISFSDLPLRLMAMFGFAVALCGFLSLGVIIVQKLWLVNYQPGYASTVSMIVFFGGLQILVTGLGSIYIGRVLKEVQGRPLYVIRSKYRL